MALAVALYADPQFTLRMLATGLPSVRVVARVLVVLATAVVVGIAVVESLTLSLFAVAGVTLVLAFLSAPAWVLMVVLVALLAASEVTRLELVASGVPDVATGWLGLGRLSLALAGLALARILLRRDVPRIPVSVVAALGIYLVSVLFEAQVLLLRGSAYPMLLGEVQRDASYLGAFLVGAIAVQSADHRLPLYRALAFIAIACCCASLAYWGWATEVTGAPPLLDDVFEHTRERVVRQGFAVDRAKFPFVLLHPNGAGFVFVSMAAFAIPPLVGSQLHRDRWLAALVGAATLGGVLSTQSRTALIAFGVGALAYVLLARGIERSTRARIFGVVFALAAAAWIVYGLMPDDRSLTDVSTLESRQAIWQDAVTAFAASPLVGHGAEVSSSDQFGADDGSGQSVHNEYLGRLVDGGLLGFALWLWVLGTFTAIAAALWQATGQRSAEGVSALAFLAVLGVTMLTNAPWSGGMSVVFIWLLFGATAGSYIAALREDEIAAWWSRRIRRYRRQLAHRSVL